MITVIDLANELLRFDRGRTSTVDRRLWTTGTFFLAEDDCSFTDTGHSKKSQLIIRLIMRVSFTERLGIEGHLIAQRITSTNTFWSNHSSVRNESNPLTSLAHACSFGRGQAGKGTEKGWVVIIEALSPCVSELCLVSTMQNVHSLRSGKPCLIEFPSAGRLDASSWQGCKVQVTCNSVDILLRYSFCAMLLVKIWSSYFSTVQFLQQSPGVHGRRACPQAWPTSS